MVSRGTAGLLAAAVGIVTSGVALTAEHMAPGPQPDGTGVTPQGWRITPAGTQTDLGSNPLAVALSPNGKVLLVTNGGYNQHSLMVVDPATGAVLQTITAGGGNSGGPWQLEEG